MTERKGKQVMSDIRELVQFSRLMAGALVLLFGVLLPWLLNKPWPYWPWLLALTFLLAGWLAPRALAPVQYWWLRFGHALGWVNSRIILGIVYYLLFTPVALVLRLFGKRPLDIKNRSAGNTYRLPATPRDDSHFERPF